MCAYLSSTHAPKTQKAHKNQSYVPFVPSCGCQWLTKQGTNTDEDEITDCEHDRHFDQQHCQ